jgi:hypothetical protein
MLLDRAGIIPMLPLWVRLIDIQCAHERERIGITASSG